MEPKVKIPKKWNDFLHVDENKKELFDFLATEVAKYDFGEEKEIVITIGSEALTLNSHVQLP